MKLELESLVRELERAKANSKDIIVDTQNIQMEPYNDDTVLNINGETYPLTDWAHTQIAEKLGIPIKYYNKMRESGKAELLAENVNAWMPVRERRLIRILYGRVRAFLSDRYRPMDNYDLLFCALDEFTHHDVEIHRCDLTETYMYIKAFQPAEIRQIETEYGTVSVIPGLILSNSEVGAGSMKVEPALLNVGCKNVFIASAQFKAVHIGRRRGEGDIWADDTLRLQDEVLWREVRDTIRAAFDTERFVKAVERFSKAAENKVESPTVVVDSIASRYNISEERKQKLLYYFAKESPTQLGVANAITRLAQDEEKAEEQVELERLGYNIVAMKKQAFNRLIKEREEEDTGKNEGIEIEIE